MRRALGLGAGSGGHTPQQRPEQARQRHRFVQDGGVPVVMLSHKPEPETAALRERIAALDAALEHERAAHQTTRRTLSEQQAQAQALQTRLAHAELAHAEALETERKLRVTAQEALAHALAQGTRVQEVPAREAVTQEAAAGIPAPARRGRRAAAAADGADASLDKPAQNPAPSADAPPKAKRGRPRINPVPEPKPVRWWTPSFRAKTKA